MMNRLLPEDQNLERIRCKKTVYPGSEGQVLKTALLDCYLQPESVSAIVVSYHMQCRYSVATILNCFDASRFVEQNKLIIATLRSIKKKPNMDEKVSRQKR